MQKMAVNYTKKVVDISAIRSRCADCNLAELCLPRGLDQQAMAKLESIIKRHHPLQRGKHLFRSGDPFVSIYAVRSGSIKQYIINDTEEQILGFYLPGEIVGLDAIDREIHRCSALALETSSFCAIPFLQLEEICEQVPGLQHQLHKLMSREISHESELMLILGNKSAEEKVASFLTNLSMRYHTLGYSPVEFRLPMSQKDIGVYLRLTPETISRVFCQLRQASIIIMEDKMIRLLNHDALKKLCAV